MKTTPEPKLGMKFATPYTYPLGDDGWTVTGTFGTEDGTNDPKSKSLMVTHLTISFLGEEKSTITVTGSPWHTDSHGIASYERLEAWDNHWEDQCGHKPAVAFFQEQYKANQDWMYVNTLKTLHKIGMGVLAVVMDAAVQAGHMTKNDVNLIIARAEKKAALEHLEEQRKGK